MSVGQADRARRRGRSTVASAMPSSTTPTRAVSTAAPRSRTVSAAVLVGDGVVDTGALETSTREERRAHDEPQRELPSRSDRRATAGSPVILGQSTCDPTESRLPSWRGRPDSREHGGMRITTNDGVGLAVEVDGERSRTAPGARLRRGEGGLRRPRARRSRATTRSSTSTIAVTARATSPTDPGAYSLERLVADTLAVADAAGLEHFRLLGHSMGGMVARRIAIREHRSASTRS